MLDDTFIGPTLTPRQDIRVIGYVTSFSQEYIHMIYPSPWTDATVDEQMEFAEMNSWLAEDP